MHQARDVLVLVCAIEQDSRVDRPALRRGELLGLHWEDIGLNAGTLEVVQTLRRVGVWPDWQENGLMFRPGSALRWNRTICPSWDRIRITAGLPGTRIEA